MSEGVNKTDPLSEGTSTTKEAEDWIQSTYINEPDDPGDDSLPNPLNRRQNSSMVIRQRSRTTVSATAAKRSRGRAFLSLLRGAYRDFQSRDTAVTNVPLERLTDYIESTVALSTVLLIVELGWEKTYDVVEDPEPLLVACLCFFHIMVYWINYHHFVRFSPPFVLPHQVWMAVLVCLGLVFYPSSLNAWVEGSRSTSTVGEGTETILYYVVNIWSCVWLSAFNFSLEIEGANDLYHLYHKAAPIFGVFWYSIAFALSRLSIPSAWMIYVAPFLYMCPLGGAQTEPPSQQSN